MSGSLAARLIAAWAMIISCTVAGHTVRLGRPRDHRADADATATVSPPAPTSGVATPIDPATALPPPMTVAPGDAARAAVDLAAKPPLGAAATATVRAVAGTPAIEAWAMPDDGLIRYEDRQAGLALRLDAGWDETDVADDAGAVHWRMRFVRGRPGRPAPRTDALPPDGVSLDVGWAAAPGTADLAAWAEEMMPLDEARYRVTASGRVGVLGHGRYRAVWREGRILPEQGRWREWCVPHTASADRVIVLRLRSWGSGQREGMLHGVYAVASLVLP